MFFQHRTASSAPTQVCSHLLPWSPGARRGQWTQSHPGPKPCPRASALATPGVFEICPYGSESFLIFTTHIVHVHQNYFSRLYFCKKRSSLPFLVIKVLTTMENLENVEIK